MGFGSVDRLNDILADLNAQRVFLVTGNKSYLVSGAKACLDELLKDYTVYRFSDYSPNPKSEDVQHGIELFAKGNYDTIIAVGGGSAIDMAKLINFLSVHPTDFKAYDFSSCISGETIRPLVAIPTTAGSGSEATKFGVLYVNKTKYSVDDDLLLPVFSIVDPDLTMSLPKYITAVSGIDAFSQAVESYWNVNSTDESKRYASQAIKLVMSNLETAVNAPTKAARFAMANAAYFAGKAINITRTTAPHAISYPLTSYFNIPHGQAVAVTIAPLLVFNSKVTGNDVQDSRGTNYVKEIINQIANLIGASTVNDAKSKIEKLISEIGLETKLSRLKIKCSRDAKVVVQNNFNLERAKNNPRILTRVALGDILNNLVN